jgi:hypothetical protein
MQSLLKSINRSILKEMYEDSATDVLSTIISKALAPAAGKTRLVIKVSLGDLKRFYLKATGAKEFVDHMSDEQVITFRETPRVSSDSSPIFAPEIVGKSLAAQTKPGREAFEIAVLLDVPKADLAAFLQIDESKLAELRAQLVKILSTKNYKMSIYVSKLKTAEKITVGADSNEENFNPVCLANYPSREMLNDAIDEWRHHFGRDAVNAKKDDPDRISADNSGTNKIRSMIIAAMAKFSIVSNPEDFMIELMKVARGGNVSKVDTVKALNKFHTETGIEQFDKVSTKILDDDTWTDKTD